MGVGGVVGTFVEVASAMEIVEGGDGPDVGFEESFGDAVGHGPGGGFGDFRVNFLRHGRMDGHGVRQGFGDFYVLLEAFPFSRGIGDVIQEQCAAAVHFKIEIPGVGRGLEEKFHGGILVGAGLVGGVPGDDVLVFHAKHDRQGFPVVEESRLCFGAMIAAQGVEIRDIQRVRLFPSRMFPVGSDGWEGRYFLDHIIHWLVLRVRLGIRRATPYQYGEGNIDGTMC